MIATLDTNVLISGTIFGGIPGRIIDASIERRFTLAVSPAILREYQNVLTRSKFGLMRGAVDALVQDMESHTLVVYPTREHNVVPDDPDDNAIVDCAVEAKADVIVNSDAHLITLRDVEGIPILTPADFIAMIES